MAALTLITLLELTPTEEEAVYHEEIILRQRRADMVRFAERQRSLKEAGLDDLSKLRHGLARVLLGVVKKLEPELEHRQSAKYLSS